MPRPELRTPAQRRAGPRPLAFLQWQSADEDDAPGALPWPLAPSEIRALQSDELELRSFEDFMDDEDPPVRRFRAVLRRRDGV